MGQQEIIDLLEANKEEWYTCREIAEELNVSQTSATNCLKILRKVGFIETRQVGNRGRYQYKASEE